MTPLRDNLLDAYGGFADRRFKDRDLDRANKIDDRDASDVYPYFWSICVSVPERTGDALRLTLQHAPSGPEVVELVETLGGTVHPADFGATIIVNLKASQGPGHQAAGLGDQGSRRPGPAIRRPQPPLDLPPHRRLPGEVRQASGPLPHQALIGSRRQEPRSHPVAASRFRRSRAPRQTGNRHNGRSPRGATRR